MVTYSYAAYCFHDIGGIIKQKGIFLTQPHAIHCRFEGKWENIEGAEGQRCFKQGFYWNLRVYITKESSYQNS